MRRSDNRPGSLRQAPTAVTPYFDLLACSASTWSGRTLATSQECDKEDLRSRAARQAGHVSLAPAAFPAAPGRSTLSDDMHGINDTGDTHNSDDTRETAEDRDRARNDGLAAMAILALAVAFIATIILFVIIN